MNDNRYLAAQYRVFSGVSLGCYTSHTQHGALIRPEGASFTIFHCREGRMECTIGQELCYISSRRPARCPHGAVARGALFLLRHYHGITACIDVAATPRCRIGLQTFPPSGGRFVAASGHERNGKGAKTVLRNAGWS